MKVLVTGHTGFKGSWLSLLLVKNNHKVSGVALDPPSEGIFERARLSQLLEHDLRVDIRQKGSVKAAIELTQPELVFHLAAQPLVRLSYEKPLETFDINVNGTLNVLHACNATEGVRALLVVTTDKVYRNLEKTSGYVETDAISGDDPYGTSKACADLITETYARSLRRRDLAIATLRSGNVIGGGDTSRDRLIPDLLRSQERNEGVLIRYPEAVRPWQHVLDALNGYLLCARNLDANVAFDAWNFGSDESDLMTVREVAQYVTAHLQMQNKVTFDQRPNPHETGLLLLNSQKAKARLGWLNKLSVRDAIDWTLEWERRAKSEDAREVCLSQIARYERLSTPVA